MGSGPGRDRLGFDLFEAFAGITRLFRRLWLVLFLITHLRVRRWARLAHTFGLRLSSEAGFESAESTERLSNRSGFAQTGIGLQQFAEVPDRDLLDFSNPIRKLFRRDLHQARVSQRFPDSLAAVLLGQVDSSVTILTSFQALRASGLLLGWLKP